MNRRWVSEQIAPAASQLAEMHGLKLTLLDGEEMFFRLQWWGKERLIWSVDLWPTFGDWARVEWDPNHKGPILPLPRPWTILDAVNAMIEAKDKQTSSPGERKRPKPTMGIRKRRH